ncbi:MAG: phytanoyl-CoA dioxygenase family protein [Pseudomonadota bacterium]
MTQDTPSVLDVNNILLSDLWLDQPDALARITERQEAGLLNDEEVKNLSSFVEQGYFTVDLELDESVTQNIESTLKTLWKMRAEDVMTAGMEYGKKMMPISEYPTDIRAGSPFRYADLHGVSMGARYLALHPTLHHYVKLILDARPIATQSLYFEYGSTQPLHRDPWYVVTKPASNLVAAWIALEDVHPDSGPLTYVPGSHRMPFYPLSTGNIIMHDPRLTQEEREQAIDFMQDSIPGMGLEVKPFCAKRGQVFFWHSTLVHGGSPINNPDLTRKSIVMHFDVEELHPFHAVSVNYDNGEKKVMRTENKFNSNGCVAFDNPLR